MASDLISRKALLEAMVEVEEKLEECMCIPSWATAIKCIRDFPTADAAPVVHGEWEVCEDDWNYETTYECSICGYEFKMEQGVEPDWRFCPRCGSKMDGGDK